MEIQRINTFNIKNYYTRIEFWIVLFFLIRLVGITNLPLEVGHNWRQITGLMVARNYLEVDANIAYPRVDDNCGQTGIIGMEFPSMNYIYFLIAKVFGYTHWYGRLINLLFSSLGVLFFYKLLCVSGIKERIAFFSTIFLSASIWFSFSRKMMPDTYCISLMFIALYYGVRYVQEGKLPHIITYTLLCSLAILSKIPAGLYLIILLPFVVSKKYVFRQRFLLSLVTALPLALTYVWYFIWNPQLSKEFGTWYNSGKSIKAGFLEISYNLGETFDNFYFDAFSGYIVFALFVIGLILMFVKKEKPLIWAFVLPFVVFVGYIFKSGFYFYHQNYYIIPFVPVMALVAGYALSCIKKRWLMLTVLVLGVIEGIGNQQHDFFIKDSEKYKAGIEQIMDSVSQTNDLIVVNGNGNPQLMYLSHRKGWTCFDEQLYDTQYLTTLIESHCKYIVINTHSTVDVQKLGLTLRPVFHNNDFVIFETSMVLPKK